MTLTSQKKLGLARRLFSRVLHTYFLISRGLTLGVRAVVRSNDGKFLLVRHTYTPGWHFPGGGVEKGETVISALRQELIQETGMHLKGDPVLHGVFYNNGVSGRDHIIVYICDVRNNGAIKNCGIEIAEAGYFDLRDLPHDTDLGTIRRMQEISVGTAQSEAW